MKRVDFTDIVSLIEGDPRGDSTASASSARPSEDAGAGVNVAMSLVEVTLKRGQREVLSKFSLDVMRGETIALVGPSGCGKSTVLRIISGLEVPESGTVLINGIVVTKDGHMIVPVEERRLGIVFQSLALWPDLTVHDNLAFGLNVRHVPHEERDRKISAILARVGLGDKEHRFPEELSGGERQRVAIARALVLEPHGALLDEPLAALDVVTKQSVGSLLRKILHERGLSALYVTHDSIEAALLADRIAVMEEGKIIQLGTPEDLQKAPATPFVKMFVDSLPEHLDDAIQMAPPDSNRGA
ncbi:MAG: ABC transporter ATP-binding protein [Polyangiaceae bacterium]|nr:ABC transporter ATP-binding protein [Polyangiaceae bacterium]